MSLHNIFFYSTKNPLEKTVLQNILRMYFLCSSFYHIFKNRQNLLCVTWDVVCDLGCSFHCNKNVFLSICIRPRFEKSGCPAEPVKTWSIVSILWDWGTRNKNAMRFHRKKFTLGVVWMIYTRGVKLKVRAPHLTHEIISYVNY